MANLSRPKMWTLKALWGSTYPTTPRNTRSATLTSLCNAGLLARVERVEHHSDGESRAVLGYVLTPRGERTAMEG